MHRAESCLLLACSHGKSGCCAQTYSAGAQVLGAVEALLLGGSALAATASIALWLRLRWQRSCALPCCGRRLGAGALLTALCAAAAVLACAALSQLGCAALDKRYLAVCSTSFIGMRSRQACAPRWQHGCRP